MLICSFCDFENSDEDRRCRRCSYPLQTWRAVFIPLASEFEAEFHSDSLKLAEGTYLDPQERYQLLEVPASSHYGRAMTAQVMDCQPAQASPIAHLQEYWLQNPDLDPNRLSEALELPQTAWPYLALQADFFPIVPELHYAWTTPTHAVLLVENRSEWQALQAAWLQTPLPRRKISWLYEMVVLWEALEPWACQHTLLQPSYLRLNAEQLLSLELLSGTQLNSQPELADLGLLWQTFLQKDPTSYALGGELGDLADALGSGKIATIDSLKQRLMQLAKEDIDREAPAESILEKNPAPIGGQGPAPLNLLNFESTEIESLSDFEEGEADGEDLTPTRPFGPNAEEEDHESLELPTMVLPMKLVQVEAAGRTYVGRQREHNEDCYYAKTEVEKLDTPQGRSLNARGVYILCDGMGGHASGEVASELAVKTLIDYFKQHWHQQLPDADSLNQGIAAANQAIYTLNQQGERMGSGRMGTTLVMLLLKDTQAIISHVGDSRLYVYSRRLGLTQLTVDHEVGQREIKRGVEPAIAYARPDAYQLTQALGPRNSSDLKPSILDYEVGEDTLFILCSDGLSDNDLLEQHCTTHVEPLLRSRADLEEGVAKLVELANEHNGHDNITVVLTRLKLRPNMDKLSGA